ALARLGADQVDPLHQPVIELLIAADGVVDALAAFDQTRQDVVDVADREGVVGAVVAHRAVLAGPQANPDFTLRHPPAAEKYVLAMLATGNQHQPRFRLRKTGQVLEVAVLSVDVLDVTVADVDRRRGQDGNAVGLHLGHQRLAPAGVLRSGNAAHGTSFSAGTAWPERPPARRTR